MRVAMLAWESLHSIWIGGLGVVVSKLSAELSKRGHEVHLFTRWVEGQEEHERLEGVYYHRCKFDPGFDLFSLTRNMSHAMVSALKWVERREGRFDLVHGHDWHVVEALHLLKQEGRRLVFTYHSTEYGRNGNKFGDWWEFREISGKEWYGGYLADMVTTVSNYMKREVCWLYHLPEEKVEVVPNAVDAEDFGVEVNPEEIKREYGLSSDPVVLFPGRLEYQKGPDLLIEAIPKVLEKGQRVRFVFTGTGSMREELERRARELGVGHVVKFLGFLPLRKYIEILRASDIVCIPSRNEPFGIVLLEAWAAGKPVVAAGVGGLDENMENLVEGIKVQPQPEAIAWGINYLLDSPSERERMVKNAREKVRNFSWKKSADKLLEVYKKTLG
ncbi:MAG: glycosyltransferase family 4 protein [Candidatus Hadarchaeales archaeon]